jgi:hypothetical protein
MGLDGGNAHDGQVSRSFRFERRSMKVRTIGIAAVLLLTLAVAGVRAEEGKEVTLVGEVVDLHCYLTRHGGEGRGAPHAGCANACISRGVSAGFVAREGTLYVLFDEKMGSPKDRVAGLAGKPVTVTGVVVERDGVRGLRLLTIEEVAAG